MPSVKGNGLFKENDLGAVLRNSIQSIEQKVDSISKDQFLSVPNQDVIEHLLDELILEPILLYEESKTMSHREIKIDVSRSFDRNPFNRPGPISISGIEITVSVPFTGNPELFKAQPSTFFSVSPYAYIKPPKSNGYGYLNIIIESPNDENPEKIKEELNNNFDLIKKYLEKQKTETEQFNIQLKTHIEQAISKRREKIRLQEGIIEFLNIPLKHREGIPEIKSIGVRRKLVRPLPNIPKEGYKPEPGIDEATYEHILSVIRHEGKTFETTPATFSIHDEEGLRDIILAHLNGHYEGGATGETFRKKGKTDVRIEDNNRAAFIGECKIWKGPKELTEAINQLLGYLTWRDCKAALIIFNKNNSNFSDLLSKAPETLRAHSRFKRDLGQKDQGEWHFVFTSEHDESQQIFIRVFLFNLFFKK